MENVTVGGYTGKLLGVDLSKHEISEETLDERTWRSYVGGAGLGAKLLYEEVPPSIAWSDPQNRLILVSGPLGGTKFGGTGNFCLTTKGALTNGATQSQANGFFGAYLKFAGFDGVIIQGAAKEWLYLYIHDGIAELKEADHLLGLDTWEIIDVIKKELDLTERQISLFGIGPAGENLVNFAVIMGDRGHAVAHNGPGAVMGSKKLKAIAIKRGQRPVSVNDAARLTQITKEALEKAKVDIVDYYHKGTRGGVIWGSMLGFLPVKNYTTNVYEIEQEKLQKFGDEYMMTHFEAKKNPCWACQFNHCHLMTITEGPYKGELIEEPDYECLAGWGPLIGNTEIGSAMKLASDVDRLGMDTNECSWTVAFAMELYEKGILNKDRLDGLELRWGNVEAARELIHKIAKREGCGKLFANGVKRAAEQLGGEALNMAIYTRKGNTPRGHDHRAMWIEMFDTCVSSTGTLETRAQFDAEPLGLMHGDPFSWEETAKWVAQTKGSMQFADSLGVCHFITSSNIKILTEALNAVTGWDFTIDEAMRMGRRTVNLLRAFNIRCGIGPELDAPSTRYGSTPIDGPNEGKSISPVWDEMLRLYRELMGWDSETSKPLPQTLKDLGLGHVIPDIWGPTEG